MCSRERNHFLVALSATSVLLLGFVFANRPLSDTLHADSSRNQRILLPEEMIHSAKAPQSPLKNLLSLLKNGRGGHRQNASSVIDQLLNGGNSTQLNSTLAFLYRLGNETNYFKNLTALHEIMNRTSRGYGGGGGWGGGGGGWGGGFDPTLLLLLNNNDHHRGYEYPYWMNNNNNQQQKDNGLDFGELALLTLLGLALISRMPTQG